MSAKSFFSHLESLSQNALSFEHPLQADFDQPRVCRYQNHLATAADLTARGQAHQPAAYRQWLPHDALAVSLDFERAAWWWEPLEPQIECDSMARLHMDPQFPIRLALPFAADLHTAFAVETHAQFEGLGRDGLTLHLHNKGDDPALSLQQVSDAARQKYQRPGIGDLGVWGNPIRSEAFKLLGLDIVNQCSNTPVVVLHDRTGEGLWGLLLASEHYRAVHQGQIPYRIVLVQEQPNDHLCRAFEGQQPDWQTLSCHYLAPPELLRTALVLGLQKHLGVAVSVETDASLWDEALARLSRGMVIEEEDEVVLLSL